MIPVEIGSDTVQMSAEAIDSESLEDKSAISSLSGVTGSVTMASDLVVSFTETQFRTLINRE